MYGIVSSRKVVVIICVREAATGAIQYQHPSRLGPNICYVSSFLNKCLKCLMNCHLSHTKNAWLLPGVTFIYCIFKNGWSLEILGHDNMREKDKIRSSDGLKSTNLCFAGYII